jgi:hypothetical protein
MRLGERNASYVSSKARILRLYLRPFFGGLPLSEVTAGRIQEYRVQRVTPPERPTPARYKIGDREFIGKPRPWKRPSRQTLHNEIVCLRQVLKTANRKGWIAALPDMTTPYRASGKVSHRAWFSPNEYKRLRDATRERANNPKKKRWRAECEQLHDYVLFMVNTGRRPDELDLKKDREGNARTAYSLRHTYICLGLIEGADIYQVAKNCRTSVEMIEKYFASHIKNTMDAAAIDVRKPPRPRTARSTASAPANA